MFNYIDLNASGTFLSTDSNNNISNNNINVKYLKLFVYLFFPFYFYLFSSPVSSERFAALIFIPNNAAWCIVERKRNERTLAL